MRILQFQVNSVLKSLLRAFNYKQNASVNLPRRYQMNFIRSTSHNKFLEEFWNTQHQNSKQLANFSSFHRCHPQRQATGNSFSTFKQSSITKLGHQFWNSIDAPSSSLKSCQIAWQCKFGVSISVFLWFSRCL